MSGAGVRALPERPDRVFVDGVVRGDEGQAMFDRLADQAAVERVLVEEREARQMEGAPVIEGETPEAVPASFPWDQCLRRRNRLSNRPRDGLRPGCSPEEDGGIEQEPDGPPPSKAAISSSGRGSRNEGGTEKAPLARPNGRGSAVG